ncbi:MAG TPA: hypothetical protein VD866_33145 [Urbifossiella sp.]|nr:hypothetical protein [Urbifossiella sp.]
MEALALIRETLLNLEALPVAAFGDRNPELQQAYITAFEQPYKLDPNPHPAYSGLEGRSSDLANRFVRVTIEYPMLVPVVKCLTRYGQGNCEPHPQGGFPVEIINRVLHFFQTPWSKLPEGQVLRFWAGVLYGTFSQPERDAYRFAAPPELLTPVTVGVPTEFVKDFKAVVDPKQALVVEPLFVWQRRHYIREALQPDELSKRAHRVWSYRAA